MTAEKTRITDSEIMTAESADAELRYAIAALTFLDTFVVGLVNPIYPQLVQSERIGATAFALIMSVANGAALASSTFFGRLSDLSGRKTAVVASVKTTAIGFALYVVGYACSGTALRLVLPAIGRVISGAGRAAFAAPIIALLAERSRSPEEASSQVARTMSTFGFGYASGSLVGGFTVGIGGTWLNLFLISICSIGQVFLAQRLPENSSTSHPDGAAPQTAAPASDWRTALRAALANRGTRAILLLQALTAASFHAYDSTSALYYTDALGYSRSERSYLLSYAGWAFALQTGLVVPRLVARGGTPKQLLTAALFFTAVGRIGLASAIAISRPTLAILVSYPVLNLGQGMSHSFLKALMSATASDSDRGLMLGALGSVERSFGVLGPLFGGPAYEYLGPAAPACLSTLLALTGCAAAAMAPSTGAAMGKPGAGAMAKKKSK